MTPQTSSVSYRGTPRLASTTEAGIGPLSLLRVTLLYYGVHNGWSHPLAASFATG
jgi:hypothetical protein